MPPATRSRFQALLKTRRFQDGADGSLRYTAVKMDLQRLLTEYGAPNKTTPAYPYFSHRLHDAGHQAYCLVWP